MIEVMDLAEAADSVTPESPIVDGEWEASPTSLTTSMQSSGKEVITPPLKHNQPTAIPASPQAPPAGPAEPSAHSKSPASPLHSEVGGGAVSEAIDQRVVGQAPPQNVQPTTCLPLSFDTAR